MKISIAEYDKFFGDTEREYKLRNNIGATAWRHCRYGMHAMEEFLRNKLGFEYVVDSTAPKVSVRLPVTVNPDGSYECPKFTSLQGTDAVDKFFGEHAKGGRGTVVYVVTCELPIPKIPEPVEFIGKSETWVKIG